VTECSDVSDDRRVVGGGRRTSWTVVMSGLDGELNKTRRDETSGERNVVSKPTTLVIDEDVVFETTEHTPEVTLVGRLVDGEVDETCEF